MDKEVINGQSLTPSEMFYDGGDGRSLQVTRIDDHSVGVDVYIDNQKVAWYRHWHGEKYSGQHLPADYFLEQYYENMKRPKR
jgi:hypothetical protein